MPGHVQRGANPGNDHSAEARDPRPLGKCLPTIRWLAFSMAPTLPIGLWRIKASPERGERCPNVKVNKSDTNTHPHGFGLRCLEQPVNPVLRRRVLHPCVTRLPSPEPLTSSRDEKSPGGAARRLDHPKLEFGPLITFRGLVAAT